MCKAQLLASFPTRPGLSDCHTLGAPSPWSTPAAPRRLGAEALGGLCPVSAHAGQHPGLEKCPWCMLQAMDSRSGAGDAHSRAGVTSCPGARACFFLSLDLFLLRLPQNHLCPSRSTSPRCFQPNMELSSGRAGGHSKDKPAVRLLRGPRGTQSLVG